MDIIKEVEDHGLGEIKLTIKEDGVWIIRSEKWTKNPSDTCISCALEDTLHWTFRGIEVFDTGEKLLKIHRSLKI